MGMVFPFFPLEMEESCPKAQQITLLYLFLSRTSKLMGKRQIDFLSLNNLRF